MKSKFSVRVSSAPSRGQALGLGALMGAIGAFICALGLGWIPSPPESFNAPREIVAAAGLAFVLGAALFALNGRAPTWVMGFIGACLWTVFALIPSWIAWGSGPRNFSGDGLWLLAVIGLDFQSVGRTVFGLSALVMWLCASLTWFAWLKGLPPIGRAPALVGLVAFAVWMVWGRYLEPGAAAGVGDAERLAAYVAAKHANPDAASGNRFLEPREELWIKRARARIAATRTPPPGAEIVDVPNVEGAPEIDGVLGENEWQGARKLDAREAGRLGRVLLMRRGGKLYVGGEAFADRTRAGFDQLRFYFHVDLAPALTNERAFVSGSGGVTGLRSVRVPSSRHEKTEWGVLTDVQGASAVTQHRQFELALDMTEAGLPAGGVVPVFIEIEGDPMRARDGRFKGRLIEGRVGTRERPVWLRLAK